MNYLLDTCVISELVKPQPAPAVAQWIRDQEEESLFLSVITIGEIQRGISRLPDGRKKKTQLQDWLQNELLGRFGERILALTKEIAICWGEILAACEKNRVSLPAIDSLIAAQGLYRGMTVVTRNVSDMEPSGVQVFNPWER